MRLDPATVAHVYRRAGFGSTKEQRAKRTTLDAVIEDLFGRREHDPFYVKAVSMPLGVGDISKLQAWWMSLILQDRAPLVERVTLMWHDHFATSNDKVDDVRLMHAQVQLFREKGLGDFRELLHAIANDPAMLVWLDGNANRKGHPNENFAREVFELFGLGIGNYTERDIQEAARAFSGLGVDGRNFVFRPQYHDEGQKEVLGHTGKFDGDDVIDLVLAHPACARHVAHKLLEEFVVPSPADAQIERWSKVLIEEEWHIERTLERLFRSEDFLGAEARRSRIAGPVELIASTLLTLESTGVVSAVELANLAEQMGQSLYRPPSVKGWDGGPTWIHAGTWLARHNHLTALAHKAELPFDDAEEALALLYPDGADAELRSAARRLSKPADLAAFLLTAPEYHLI